MVSSKCNSCILNSFGRNNSLKFSIRKAQKFSLLILNDETCHIQVILCLHRHWSKFFGRLSTEGIDKVAGLYPQMVVSVRESFDQKWPCSPFEQIPQNLMHCFQSIFIQLSLKLKWVNAFSIKYDTQDCINIEHSIPNRIIASNGHLLSNRLITIALK